MTCGAKSASSRFPQRQTAFTQNSEETVSNTQNLKPWPKGVSGNPGGRPKTKPLTEELERLLDEEAPKSEGESLRRKFTMKRGGNISEQPLAPRRLAGMNADSQALAVKKKAQEKLIDALITTASKVTGVRSHEVADRIIVQVSSALAYPRPKDVDERLTKAFAAIAELAPQNATEAMLATQMVAANDAALMFLSQATLETQSFEARDANVLRAARLMRIFSEQVEVMQKLKGRTSQQRVIVEHVHINEGGQAIVGTVATRGPASGEGG
jgi:hypothetical protein